MYKIRDDNFITANIGHNDYVMTDLGLTDSADSSLQYIQNITLETYIAGNIMLNLFMLIQSQEHSLALG